MAARTFVIHRRDARQPRCDVGVFDEPGAHALRREHARRDSDIDDVDPAAVGKSGRARERDLERGHADRPVCVDRDAEHAAGVGVEAGWDIEREPARGAVDHGDHVGEVTFDRALEPDAEQRVDRQCGAGDRATHLGERGRRVGHAHDTAGTLEDRQVRRRVALDPRGRHGEIYRRVDAHRAQHARGDEAIAAVVAGPAHDGDVIVGSDHLACRGGDGSPGRLHQRQRGQPDLLDRRTIERTHLGRRDDGPHARQAFAIAAAISSAC